MGRILSALLAAGLATLASPAAAGARAPRALAAVGTPAAVEPLPTYTPAWQVAWGGLAAGAADAIAYTSYAGVLTLQRIDGERLWDADLGAFAYAIRFCDLDRDGRNEVITAAASGEVRVYDGRGHLRWQAQPGGHPLSLACGRLLVPDATHLAVGTTEGAILLLAADGRTARRLAFPLRWRRPPAVRGLDAADPDGDGRDELLVANYEKVFGVVDPRTGEALWQRETRERLPWIFSTSFVDLAGDGRPEAAVAGKERLVVARDGRELFERPVGLVTAGFSTGLLAPVDLDGDGKQELAVLNGPELSVLDAAGDRVYGASTAQYYFTSIASPPRPGRQVLLGSIAGPDQNVYRVTFGAAKRDQLQALLDPPGPRTEIVRSLLALRERVLAAPVDPGAKRRRYYFNLDNDAGTPEKLRAWLREQRAFRAAYPYENLVFHHNVTFSTRGKRARPLAEMLALAERMEEQGFLHIITVGHSLDAENDVASVQKWLERAPTTCLGVRVSELSIEAGLGARADAVAREIDRFYAPLLDLAARRGIHAELLMKRNFWILAPASARFRDAFFSAGRRASVVATEEGSYTRAPENALMARVGLWRAGLVGAWGVRVIDDDLRLDRFFDHQSADTSHILRSLVSAAAAGATHFSVKPRYLLRDLRGLRGHNLAPGLVFNDDGLASVDLFLHLLVRGVLDVPTPATIESLAPVEWRFEEPAAELLRESERRDLPDERAARAAGAFTGVAAGRTPTPPSYASRALLGVERFGLAFYPENPFGLPAILPAWAPATAAAAVRTDGERVALDGEWGTGPAAIARAVERFRSAAGRLPVRAEGAHWMSTRRADGALRVTLVDPSYLAPRARRVRLLAARPITSLIDVVTGAALPHETNVADVALGAGSFRILDVRLADPGRNDGDPASPRSR